MDVKRGYKQTGEGLIPEDWSLKQINDFATTVASGKSRVISEFGDYPVFGSTGIIGSCFSSDYSGIAVLIARVGANAGKLTVVSGKYGVTDNTIIVRIDESLDHGFFWRQLESRRLNSMVFGSGQPLITGTQIKSIRLPIPPTKVEQEAIAGALSDADALIESLEQLLAKKRQIKQGTMQELLTGKKRLPGFTAKWKDTILGDMGTFLKGRGISRDQCGTGDLPCVRYGELYTNHDEQIRDYFSWISPTIGASATRIKRGDVLFAGSGETKEEIGKCAVVTDDREAYAGGDIVILRTGLDDPRFLGYYLNTPSINLQKASRGQGDAVVHISSGALAHIKCKLPEPSEQTAIADVLSTMDAGIFTLETKLSKLRQLKQGMMQELLTGSIRLVQLSAEVVPFPVKQKARTGTNTDHNPQINEAVVLAVLAHRFGSEQFPLGRFRRTKLSYLLHRHTERQVAGFMKKAAGPYNPHTRYGGAEKISLKNGYVRIHQTAKGEGFIAANNIVQAEGYFESWYGLQVLDWLKQFRYKKNEELELLTTVDMAIEDLRREGKSVTVAAVKQIIHESPEWKAKLDRATFADSNIAAAIESCRQLFPVEE